MNSDRSDVAKHPTSPARERTLGAAEQAAEELKIRISARLQEVADKLARGLTARLEQGAEKVVQRRLGFG